MTRPKHGKKATVQHDRDRKTIARNDVESMKRVFEKARRVVKPIVKRESAAEVVSVELLNTRLKDANRT